MKKKFIEIKKVYNYNNLIDSMIKTKLFIALKIIIDINRNNLNITK